MFDMWPNEDDLILFWLRNGEPLSADNIMRASKEIYQRLVKQAEAGMLNSCLIPATLGDRSLLEPRIIPQPDGTVDLIQTGTPLELGTAVGGTSITIVLPSGASSVNDYYNGYKIRITDGTGQGQERTVISYVGSTRTATVVAWVTTPDVTSQYELSYRRLADNDIIVVGNLFFKGSEISSYQPSTIPLPVSADAEYWIYYDIDKIIKYQAVSDDPDGEDPNKLYIARIVITKTTGKISYMEDLRGFTFLSQDSKKVRFVPGVVRAYGTVKEIEESGGFWLIGEGARWQADEWNGKTVHILDGVDAGISFTIVDTRPYTSEISQAAILLSDDCNTPAGSHFVIIDTRISGDSVYDGLLHHGHQGGNDGEQITPAGISDAVAGAGLIKDGLGALAVNPDDSSVEVTADQVKVKELGIRPSRLATQPDNLIKNGSFEVTTPGLTTPDGWDFSAAAITTLLVSSKDDGGVAPFAAHGNKMLQLDGNGTFVLVTKSSHRIPVISSRRYGFRLWARVDSVGAVPPNGDLVLSIVAKQYRANGSFISDVTLGALEVTGGASGESLLLYTPTPAVDVSLVAIQISGTKSARIAWLDYVSLKEMVETGDILDDAVTRDKINANVAGDGLGQGSLGQLQVNVDNATLQVVADVLQVKAVGTSQLIDESVTLPKLSPDIVALIGAGVRSATIVVAANDSSSDSKAGADFVCDGTDDHIQINSAFSALPFAEVESALLSGVVSGDALNLASTASPKDDYYNGMYLTIGTQTIRINNYIGSTKLATLDSPFTPTPLVGTAYTIKVKSGIVHLCEGTYKLGGAINAMAFTTLQGSGASSILRPAIAIGEVVLGVECQHFVAKNFTINGNRSVLISSNITGFSFDTSPYILIENIFFYDFKSSGIFISQSKGATIRGCVFERFYSSNNSCVGVYLSNTSNTIVSENKFIDFTFGGTVDTIGAIYDLDGLDNVIKNNFIDGVANKGCGIYGSNSDRVTINGNKIINIVYAAVGFGGGSVEGQIINNYIDTCLYGFYFPSGTNQQVANNNIIYRATGAGIYLGGGDVLVSGNRIHSCALGISIASTVMNASIVNNFIETCSSYSIYATPSENSCRIHIGNNYIINGDGASCHHIYYAPIAVGSSGNNLSANIEGNKIYQTGRSKPSIFLGANTCQMRIDNNDMIGAHSGSGLASAITLGGTLNTIGTGNRYNP